MPKRFIRPQVLVGFALAASALSGAMTASAQGEPVAQPPAPEARDADIQRLEEQIRSLQDQVNQLKQAPSQPKPTLDASQVQKIVEDRLKQQKPTAGWQDGFFIQSPDGNFKLRVGGYVQTDFRAFLAKGATAVDNFTLRRVRPILEGTLYKNVGFRLMPDFGEGKTVLQDAYLNLTLRPEAQLRAGKFKEPLSLERLQSGTDLLFPERSVTNNLAPNRDVGIQLSGDVARGTITYALGGFNGVADGGSSDGDGGTDKDLAWRVFAQPWRNKQGSPLQSLGFGVAGTYGGREESLSSVAYKTAGRTTFFRYDPAAVGIGTQTRLAPQLYYYAGPFGLLGEYITSHQSAQKGATRASLSNHGWFAQVSYVLTGEKAGYKSVVPSKPFDLDSHQWGAWELAVRYAVTQIDPKAFALGLSDPSTSAGQAKAWTLGVNWYLNKAVKVQLNWERTDFDRAIKIGSTKPSHEDLFASRFQVAF
ncbi:MAG TPA: porin [Armatimonadota bacterium]